MMRISFGKRVDNSISMLLLSLLVFLLASQQVVCTLPPPQEISACGDYTAATNGRFKLVADLTFPVDEGCVHITDQPTSVEFDGNGHTVTAELPVLDDKSDFTSFYMFWDGDKENIEMLSYKNIKMHGLGIVHYFEDWDAVTKILKLQTLTVENCEFHNSFGAAIAMIDFLDEALEFNSTTIHHDIIVRNNKFINHPASSAFVAAIGYFKSLVVDNNICNFNASNFLDVDNPFDDLWGGIMVLGAGNVTVHNNKFSGGSPYNAIQVMNHIVADIYDVYHPTTVVENNVFVNTNASCAIIITAYTMDKGEYEAVLAARGPAPNTFVRNNVISNSDMRGFAIVVWSMVGASVVNNTIKNTVTRGYTRGGWFEGGTYLGGGILVTSMGKFAAVVENNAIDKLKAFYSCSPTAGIFAVESESVSLKGNKITNVITDNSCVDWAKKRAPADSDKFTWPPSSRLYTGIPKNDTEADTKNTFEELFHQKRSNDLRSGFQDYLFAGIFVGGVASANITNNIISNVVVGLSAAGQSSYGGKMALGLVVRDAAGSISNVQVDKIYGSTRAMCEGCNENDGNSAMGLYLEDADFSLYNIKISDIQGGNGGPITKVDVTNPALHSAGGSAYGVLFYGKGELTLSKIAIFRVLSGKRGTINGVDPCKQYDWPFGPLVPYNNNYDDSASLPDGVTYDGANNTCYRYKRPVVNKAVIVQQINTKRATQQATYVIDVWGESFGQGIPGELKAWISGYKCSQVDYHTETYFTCTLHGHISGTNLPVLVTVRALSNDRLFTAVVDFPDVTPVGLPTCIPPFGAQDPLNPEICNCFSGHAPSSQLATDCNMDAKCPGKVVTLTSIDHHASRPTITFTNDRLTVVQTTPIVKGRRDTHIKLVGIDGVTESTETCNFPGPIWTKSLSALDCLDIYTGVIPWTQNGMCGFQKVIGGDASKLIYSANLVMTYRDLMPSQGKTPSYRLTTESHVITVEFSRQLTVALSSTALISVIQDESQIDLEVTSSALYDPATKETFVTFRTTANSPYKLNTMDVFWTPGYTPTDEDFGYPMITAALATQAGDAVCAGVPEVCEQDWTLTIVTFLEGTQTCNLKGTITLVPGPLFCRDLSPIEECDNVVGTVSNLTITVSDDTDLCEGSDDEVDASQNVESMVATFADEIYAEQQDSFQVGDMCYVRIAVRSPQATLDSILFNQITIGDGEEENLYKIQPMTINEDASFNITWEKKNDGQLVSPTDIALLTFQFRLSRKLYSLSTLGGEQDSIALEVKVVLDLKFHGNAEEPQLDKKRAVSGSNYFQSTAKHAIMLTLPEGGYDEQNNLADEQDLFGDLSGDASLHAKLNTILLFAVFAVSYAFIF